MKWTDAEDWSDSPPIAVLRRILSALPYGVSWATLPGAHIEYCNPEFERLFGYGQSYFRTAGQVIDELYLHERDRELTRKNWFDFGVPREMAFRSLKSGLSTF